MNHRITDDDGEHPGWVVVSPRRHVTRWFELTPGELTELARVCATLDRVLTEVFDSHRTMVASLGWWVHDHLHVHCVPTFDPDVTRGFENFDDAYVPPPLSAARAERLIAQRFSELI